MSHLIQFNCFLHTLGILYLESLPLNIGFTTLIIKDINIMIIIVITKLDMQIH